MRILVIGNSYSSKIISDILSKNNDNLVFSTHRETNGNFIDINFLDVAQLKDFALANEIELTILSDFEAIEKNFVEEFTQSELSIFAPDFYSKKICSQKAYAKKFMYKNKIKTPHFQIFDKPNLAYEYIRNATYPIIIKPDEHINPYGTTICETYKNAKEMLEKLFETDTKTVVIEKYIQGEEFSFYFILDGFNSFLIDSVITKQNRYAILSANNIDVETIKNNFINPTIEGLLRSENNYLGILGIDFIKDENGEIYALEYNPFFESLDCNLLLNSVETPIEKLFEGAILGTLKDEYENIQRSDKPRVSLINDKGEVEYSSGRTLNEAIENLESDEWKF